MTSQAAAINSRPRLYLQGEQRVDLATALLDAHICLPLSGMANAELRLVNWQSNTDNADAGFAFQAIELGQTLEVLTGEPDQPPLFSGEITALEERYGQGAPQLVVLAEDGLHRLAKARYNRTFEGMGLADIIRSIASEANLTPDISVSDINQTWHQLNESNLAFLQRVLAPYDLALRLQDGTLRVKPEEEDPAPYAMHPQRGVESVRIIADLNHQPRVIRVSGFDLNSDSEIRANHDQIVPKPEGKVAAETLGDLSWGSEETLPQPFARSQGEADAWAEARFRNQANRFLHGDIVCSGVAELRSGREIELTGVSSRLSGRYQVVDSVHSFDTRQGYQTRLKVQRSSWQI